MSTIIHHTKSIREETQRVIRQLEMTIAVSEYKDHERLSQDEYRCMMNYQEYILRDALSKLAQFFGRLQAIEREAQESDTEDLPF